MVSINYDHDEGDDASRMEKKRLKKEKRDKKKKNGKKKNKKRKHDSVAGDKDETADDASKKTSTESVASSKTLSTITIDSSIRSEVETSKKRKEQQLVKYLNPSTETVARWRKKAKAFGREAFKNWKMIRAEHVNNESHPFVLYVKQKLGGFKEDELFEAPASHWFAKIKSALRDALNGNRSSSTQHMKSNFVGKYCSIRS